MAQQARPPGPGRGGFGPAGPGVRRVMPNKKPINKRDLPGWVRSTRLAPCLATCMHLSISRFASKMSSHDHSEVDMRVKTRLPAAL